MTRITPARAGTTDQPIHYTVGHLGSPPLARELPDHKGLFPFSTGITPARAGTTIHGTLTRWKSWDHPRSRGNYIKKNYKKVLDTGSPPLARELL